jgi:hypothetical protein
VIAIALLDLNVAGVCATLSYFPRERLLEPDDFRILSFGGPVLAPIDDETAEFRFGPIRISPRKAALSIDPREARLIRRPPRPNLLQILSPIIASVSITLLVVIVPQFRRQSSQASHEYPLEKHASLKWDSCWLAFMIIALIGLNIAGAVYRRPPHPADPWRRDIEDYQVPLPLVIGPCGTPSYSRVGSNGGRPGVHSDSHQAYVGMIVFRTDGSVIGYEGAETRNPSRAHTLQAPTHSLLEMWWPLIGSVTITIVALAAAARCLETPVFRRIRPLGGPV